MNEYDDLRVNLKDRSSWIRVERISLAALRNAHGYRMLPSKCHPELQYPIESRELGQDEGALAPQLQACNLWHSDFATREHQRRIVRTGRAPENIPLRSDDDSIIDLTVAIPTVDSEMVESAARE